MKGYKGFGKGLVCRGKQYAENTVFEEYDAEICRSGMHFCALPHQVFSYYAPSENHEFAEVEALDDPVTDDDAKYCSKKLRIGAKISVFDMVKASVCAFFERVNFAGKIAEATQVDGAANAGDWGAANAGSYGAANAGSYGAANAGDYGAANAGYRGAANAGYRGAANAGDCGAANAGYRGAANAGDYGAANAGYRGAANAGDWGAANAGDWGAANAGDWGAANAGSYGAANAGYRGAANAGDWGAAIARKKGKASVGRNGIAAVIGNGGNVSGKVGAILLLVDTDDDGNALDFAAVKVDRETIKENTWYKLEGGNIVEVIDNA